MDRIISAKVFIAIVERGSMVAAAESLNMSRSMVTRHLAHMEDWAGSQLLYRSTRHLSLTQAGEKILEYCHQLINVAREVPLSATKHQKKPTGLLKITSAHFLASDVLPSIIQTYLKRYPEVSIELNTGDQIVNLVENKIDLAIRISNNLDPNLIARRLGDCHSVICASPEYLRRNGHPKTPDDLKNFNCFSHSYSTRGVWGCTYKDVYYNLPSQGNFTSNETSTLLKLTLMGDGFSVLPKSGVQPYINAGKLVPLLPEYQLDVLGVYGVFRSRKYMSLALRTWIDILAESFKNLDI